MELGVADHYKFKRLDGYTCERMSQLTAIEVRRVICPRCHASPGHPCVEDRRTGHAGKHYGATRRNHAERIAEYTRRQ